MSANTFFSWVGVLCILVIFSHHLQRCSVAAEEPEIPSDVSYIDSTEEALVVMGQSQFRSIANQLHAWNYWCMSHFLKHVRVGDRLVEYSVARPNDELAEMVIRTQSAYLVFSGPEVADGCSVIR